MYLGATYSTAEIMAVPFWPTFSSPQVSNPALRGSMGEDFPTPDYPFPTFVPITGRVGATVPGPAIGTARSRVVDTGSVFPDTIDITPATLLDPTPIQQAILSNDPRLYQSPANSPMLVAAGLFFLLMLQPKTPRKVRRRRRG